MHTACSKHHGYDANFALSRCLHPIDFLDQPFGFCCCRRTIKGRPIEKTESDWRMDCMSLGLPSLNIALPRHYWRMDPPRVYRHACNEVGRSKLDPRLQHQRMRCNGACFSRPWPSGMHRRFENARKQSSSPHFQNSSAASQPHVSL